MQLKHAIAAALSFVLLSATSLASACELSCSLTPSHPVSASAAARTTSHSFVPGRQATTAEMSLSHSHCGHAQSAQRSSTVAHQWQDASTCGSAPCTQAETLSSAISAKAGSQIETCQLAFLAILSPVSAIGNPSDTVKLEHAPSKVLLLDRLSLALRV